MQNFVGLLEYMCQWCWVKPGLVKAADDNVFETKALPFMVNDEGEIEEIGKYEEGAAVFASDRHAFDYMLKVTKRDLQYRGMRDDRLASFHWKQDANLLLYRHVRKCEDAAEYELLRQRWDTVNRPKYRDLKWGPKQKEALAKVQEGVSIDDEEARQKSFRWLYIAGAPGSGKSAVILEAAVWAARNGYQVLIVCPTGLLVHHFKSQLPEVDGIENVRVDTIQGVLKYKRPGKDEKVRWAPPSALRRIDLILVDEGSQYDDQEWERFFTCVKEQPHLPYTVVVADFQQLQPVVSGGKCKAFCERMVTVTLDTVYRSTDEEHLLFQNRIRFEQPTRERLTEYFGDHHWRRYSLDECVAYGMQMAKETEKVFTWLTSTNRGSSEVCAAALRIIGISEADLENGYLCDPSTKSDLRIVARKGILIRLSRNFDKQRGFVNGAYAVIEDSLRGNAVFTARLIGTGNMVLVHPMEEDSQIFLPCCYGYATTIRRAQGASLEMGCIYFDQKHFPAGRGYGYVAVSRFKTRAGVYVFGRLRRTDFLPVGEEREDEVLERGYNSLSSDDEEDEHGRGLEYAFPSEGEESEHEPQEDHGSIIADFG
jgi:hypothetical protein